MAVQSSRFLAGKIFDWRKRKKVGFEKEEVDRDEKMKQKETNIRFYMAMRVVAAAGKPPLEKFGPYD